MCIETYHMSLQRSYKALYNATIVIRFVGTSAGSTTSRLLMKSICHQLSRVYGQLTASPTTPPPIPLATENLLENADGAAACCLLCMLTRALCR